VILLITNARAAVIFSDAFTYPDGALVGAPGSPWANHSGTAGQVNVVSNQVSLTQAESEDVNAVIAGGPYTSGTLYAGIDINFSSLPTGTGGYFFHFKDATASGFRGRVFAEVTDAAAGTFRLAITNGSNSGYVSIPTDISLNTTHRLVLAYDTAAVVSTIYLDSLTETGGAVATDVVTPFAITSIALRQSVVSGAGMGTLTADNLIVGTTFADVAVVPEPASLGFVATALFITGRRLCRRRLAGRTS
jgi:hypothetical protein